MLLFLLTLFLSWERVPGGTCVQPSNFGVSDNGLFAWAEQYDGYHLYYRDSSDSSFGEIDTGVKDASFAAPLAGPGWLSYAGKIWFNRTDSSQALLDIVDVSPDMSHYLSLDLQAGVATSFRANNTRAMQVNVTGTDYVRVADDGSICVVYDLQGANAHMNCTSFPDRIVSTIHPPAVPANYTVTSNYVVWTPLGYRFVSALSSKVSFPLAFVMYDNTVFWSNLLNLEPLEKAGLAMSTPFLTPMPSLMNGVNLVNFTTESATVQGVPPLVTPHFDGYLFTGVSPRGQQAMFSQFQSKDPSDCPVTLLEVRPVSAGPSRECDHEDSSTHSATLKALTVVLSVLLLLMVSFMCVVMYFHFRKGPKGEAGENDYEVPDDVYHDINSSRPPGFC